MNADVIIPVEGLPSITAMLGYSADIKRARTDLIDPPLTHMPQNFREVVIHDARGIRDQLDLDREGFTLIERKTAVTDFSNTEQFADAYFAEAIEILRGMTTADHFIPARKYLALRQPAVGDHDIDFIKAPSNLVHMDFTQVVFMDLLRLALEEAGRSGEVFSRAALYQLWRPLSDPPEDFPFALVDSRSAITGDFVVMDNIIGPTDVPGNQLQTRLGIYRPEHRWFWFSNMTRDELVVFKGNDTMVGDTQCVLHAAFDNRPNELAPKPRYSVEARVFALWN